MFQTDDTIVAIATPPGRGGLGVVRISGASASRVASALLQLHAPLQPRHATFARVKADQVVVTYFPAPHSYTGEHSVEILREAGFGEAEIASLLADGVTVDGAAPAAEAHW